MYEEYTVIDIYSPYANDFGKIVAAGVSGSGIYVDSINDNFGETGKKTSAWYQRIERESDKALLALNADDIKRAKREKKVGIIMSLPSFSPIESDLNLLTAFHKLGIRFIGLTYNARNLVGDGCTEKKNSGLSEFGIQAVEEMNRLGLIIDLAHTGVATSMETIELSKDPVIVSHANARAICDMPRNKTDEEIKALAAKGGIICVRSGASYVSKTNKEPTVEHLIDHVEHIASLVGTDYIGIGLDIPEGQPDYTLTFTSDIRSLSFPIGSITEMPIIADALLHRGYSDQDAKKIMGGNILRVFERVIKT